MHLSRAVGGMTVVLSSSGEAAVTSEGLFVRLLAGVPMTPCCCLPPLMNRSSTWSGSTKVTRRWWQTFVGLSQQHQSLILRR